MFQLGSCKLAYPNRKRASVNFVNFPSREILRDSSGRKDITRALALEILKDPAAFHVNVHNADFPNGAIRGQLAK